MAHGWVVTLVTGRWFEDGMRRPGISPRPASEGGDRVDSISTRERSSVPRLRVILIVLLGGLWLPGCGEDTGDEVGPDTNLAVDGDTYKIPDEGIGETTGPGTTDAETTESETTDPGTTDAETTGPCSPNPCLNGGDCSPEEDGESVVCSCAGTGYEGPVCGEDLDECATDYGGCHPSAACINVPGSHLCKCPQGTIGDGASCGPDPTTLTYQGLHGYISSGSGFTPDEYRYGASFYSSAWRLTPEPLKHFQIGLPGTWFTPNNSDNTTTALCPPGTLAGDNWPERAPTYATVFQTMEGGLGYWANNQYRYGPPKFSMNATPDCYTNQIASPGWPFFGGPATLPDDTLGIAQLSNRMLIPPDGLPFEGDPQGELIGYGFIALPLTDARPDPQPTGEQSWTLFLNSANFKGPLAYYLPETWSKISKSYAFDEGRGLDSRPINGGLGGSMEINTVQQFQAVADDGVLYTKTPQLQFPVDAQGRTVLVRDLTYYSKGALYDDVLAWRAGGAAPNGEISEEASFKPGLGTYPVTYKQSGEVLSGINELATPTIFEGEVFGLQWTHQSEAGMAKFPRYFRQQGGQRVAISEEEVPPETQLTFKEFPTGTNPGSAYSATPLNGSWASPGPALGPYEADLGDCSTVTYYWYKFIDQPVFQQYAWTPAEKAALQGLVEQMHLAWTPDKEYLAAPGGGTLGGFDAGLMVTPPEGYETGYVPLVTHQTASAATGCPAQVNAEQVAQAQAAAGAMTSADLVGVYHRFPVENGYHEVNVFLDDTGQLWWQNQSVQWTLTLDESGLSTGADCPYGELSVAIELLEGPDGQVYGIPEHLIFSGESYDRIWNQNP
jgi:hypothetical protein